MVAFNSCKNSFYTQKMILKDSTIQREKFLLKTLLLQIG